MAEFSNFTNVNGEVADVSLDDLGERKNAQCNLNVSCGDNFITVQLNSPRNADRNYAEQLFDEVVRGDFVKIIGTLEEYEYDGSYIRNVSPFVGNETGYSNSIDIYDKETVENREGKATARISGDVMNIEEYFEDETRHLEFEILYYDTYNPQGDEELTRKQVVKREIENFINYIQNQDNTVEQDVRLAKEHLESLKNAEDENPKQIANVIKEFEEDFNPRTFNLTRYHATAVGDMTEKMEHINVFDNISIGVYIKNEIQIDEFGYSDGTTNMLEIGKLQSLNEEFQQSDLGGLDW